MNIREIAFSILLDIYKKGTYSNLALNKALNDNELIPQDKAFLTRLVYGVIQNSLRLDYYIDVILKDEKIRTNMRILLKCALYQMRFMDKVPDYAIIHETVEIVKQMDGYEVSKFANAILRKLRDSEFEILQSMFATKLEYYSVYYSCPLWIMRLIAKQYSEEKAIRFAELNQVPPRLCLRVNTMITTRAQLLKKAYFSPGTLSEDALYYDGELSLQDLEEFKAGLVTAEDESGQLVSRILEPSQDDYILDMCAAPGSKTGHLAELMKNQGRIVAVDIHPHRVNLLNQSLNRLSITNTTALALDALTLHTRYREQTFDRILLDCPCSGLGVVRRKPDITLRLLPQDLDGLVILQRQLIDEAAILLKKGGTLVYSTCTLNKKENDLQTKYLLEKHSEFKLISEKTIFTEDYSSDGFYIAKFIKE